MWLFVVFVVVLFHHHHVCRVVLPPLQCSSCSLPPLSPHHHLTPREQNQQQRQVIQSVTVIPTKIQPQLSTNNNVPTDMLLTNQQNFRVCVLCYKQFSFWKFVLGLGPLAASSPIRSHSPDYSILAFVISSLNSSFQQ